MSILIDKLPLCSLLAYFIRHNLSCYLIYFIHVCHLVGLPVALGSIACFVILRLDALLKSVTTNMVVFSTCMLL